MPIFWVRPREMWPHKIKTSLSYSIFTNLMRKKCYIFFIQKLVFTGGGKSTPCGGGIFKFKSKLLYIYYITPIYIFKFWDPPSTGGGTLQKIRPVPFHVHTHHQKVKFVFTRFPFINKIKTKYSKDFIKSLSILTEINFIGHRHKNKGFYS